MVVSITPANVLKLYRP